MRKPGPLPDQVAISHLKSRAPQRRNAAARQRLARERRRSGEVVFRICANHADIVEALIRAGRLSESAALRQRQVESALSSIVNDSARRWLV
jgi:hypothetical protein